MRAAVSCAFGEAQMRLLRQVVDPLRREPLDRLGQTLREIRGLYRFWNFGLRQFCSMQNKRLVLDERPFYRGLRAIDINALTILARNVKERPIDSRAQVRIF